MEGRKENEQHTGYAWRRRSSVLSVFQKGGWRERIDVEALTN